MPDVPSLTGPLVHPRLPPGNVRSLANTGHITAPLGRDPRPGGAPGHPGGAVLWPEAGGGCHLYAPQDQQSEDKSLHIKLHIHQRKSTWTHLLLCQRALGSQVLGAAKQF